MLLARSCKFRITLSMLSFGLPNEDWSTKRDAVTAWHLVAAKTASCAIRGCMRLAGEVNHPIVDSPLSISISHWCCISRVLVVLAVRWSRLLTMLIAQFSFGIVERRQDSLRRWLYEKSGVFERWGEFSDDLVSLFRLGFGFTYFSLYRV